MQLKRIMLYRTMHTSRSNQKHLFYNMSGEKASTWRPRTFVIFENFQLVNHTQVGLNSSESYGTELEGKTDVTSAKRVAKCFYKERSALELPLRALGFTLGLTPSLLFVPHPRGPESILCAGICQEALRFPRRPIALKRPATST